MAFRWRWSSFGFVPRSLRSSHGKINRPMLTACVTPGERQSSYRKNADLMGSAHLRRRWCRLKRNRCPEVNRQNVLPTVGVTRGGAPCAAIIIGRTTVKGSKARPRHCVRSVGVTGPCTGRLFGGRGPIETAPQLVDWHEPFVPLRREVLDLLEIQDRGCPPANDCRPLAFLG